MSTLAVSCGSSDTNKSVSEAVFPEPSTDSCPGPDAGAEPFEAQGGLGSDLPASYENPETISAEELHQLLMKAYVLGSRVRLRFLKALLALHRMRLYIRLGFSSTTQYAARYFGYQKSQTYESLRVAECLERLPLTTGAFSKGSLSWSAVKAITRVAAPDTEEAWIEFATKRSIEEVKAEVHDAVKKNRKLPRKDRYGLPHLKSQLSFELEPQEHAIVEQALGKAAAEMGEALNGSRPRPHEALIYLATRYLESDGWAGSSGKATGAESGQSEAGAEAAKRPSPYTILFRVCPTCRTSHVATGNGFVEIPEEVVSRVEGEAEKEVIPVEAEIEPLPQAGEEPAGGNAAQGEAAPVEKDRPNTRSLVRRVLLRDGKVCANPNCGRREGLHVHHVKFRSKGGRTELWNEVLLCDRCHSLCHAGLLEIRGDPGVELEFIPAAEKVELDFAKENEELSGVPVVVVRPFGQSGVAALPRPRSPGSSFTTVESGLPGGEFSTTVESASAPGSRVSTTVENGGRPFHEEFPDALRALEVLGYSERDAKARLACACEEFVRQGKKLEEEALLNRALRVRI